jgi:hypothetical protein
MKKLFVVIFDLSFDSGLFIVAVDGDSMAPGSVMENWSDQPTMKVRVSIT